MDAIQREVRALAPDLPRRETDRAAALLAYLCSLQAWISLQEESGMSAERAQDALLWGIALIQNQIVSENRKKATR